MTPHEPTQTAQPALMVREVAALYSIPEREVRQALAAGEIEYHLGAESTVYVTADNAAAWAARR